MMLKARYVVTADGPVIEDGGVAVSGEQITAVGPAREVHGSPVIDYGDAVIGPGFVNAHTHLELTDLAGRVPPTPDFVEWLGRLIAARREESLTKERIQAAVRAGVRQSLRAGVTTVGDITSTPAWTREALDRVPLCGVSFGEVIAIGSRRDRLAERLEAAATWKTHGGRLRVGLSPHAPYSVEPAGLIACAGRAKEIDVPLCIHLAESADELRFTRSGDGPLLAFLRQLGVWDRSIPVGGCGPIELADRNGLLGPSTVVAHANYVTDADIERLTVTRSHVAFCPRTHHAFEHPPHRWADMLASGVNVCLGTDSLASNPSLSILEELRFLHRQCPHFSPDELFRTATIRGAAALGVADETGSLTVGKQADIVVIPLPAERSAKGWWSILESTAQPVAVYVSGCRQAVESEEP